MSTSYIVYCTVYNVHCTIYNVHFRKDKILIEVNIRSKIKIDYCNYVEILNKFTRSVSQII